MYVPPRTHSRSSVSSDMRRLRKTLTYLLIYLLTYLLTHKRLATLT